MCIWTYTRWELYRVEVVVISGVCFVVLHSIDISPPRSVAEVGAG